VDARFTDTDGVGITGCAFRADIDVGAAGGECRAGLIADGNVLRPGSRGGQRANTDADIREPVAVVAIVPEPAMEIGGAEGHDPNAGRRRWRRWHPWHP
jgi:hypothetical protein